MTQLCVWMCVPGARSSAQRLAVLDRAGQDLVARRHARQGRDVTLDLGVGQDVHARDDDVVVGMEADGERCGH
jgi:hypothetical protein